MPLFALNHGPSTSAEWKARIEDLRQQLADAEQRRAEAGQARKEADAQSVLTGKASSALVKLESEELAAERRVTALHAPLEMASAQLQKALAAEEAERQEKLRRLRAELRAQIVARAKHVDELFSAAAAELTAIDALLGESFRAGRGVAHRVKWYATRAMISCGLQPYFDPSIGWSHRELLSTQLDRLLAEPAEQQPQEKSA